MNLLNLTPMLWGINRTELRFLIQNGFRDISDLRYPAMAKLNFESENYLYYSIRGRTVFFYFNSDGMYYRAVERFTHDCSKTALRKFFYFDNFTFGKNYSSFFRSQGVRIQAISLELKWKNANFESGFEQHLYTSASQFPGFDHFINVEGLSSGWIPFDDYPELELTSRAEVEGMLIENRLRPNPENPSFLMWEVVFTSTYLTGD